MLGFCDIRKLQRIMKCAPTLSEDNECKYFTGEQAATENMTTL